MHSCNGSHWMNSVIINESEEEFKSIKIVMHDNGKNITRSVKYNNFPVIRECEGLTWVETIPAGGDPVVVAGPKFDYNIRGTSLTANVTICTEKGFSGICTTKKLEFNP